jgi:hypothetical protein
MTALHYAAGQFYCGDDIIEILINHGSDVNCLSQRGHSPLYLAVSYNKFDAVEFLLSHEANPHINCGAEAMSAFDLAQSDITMRMVFEQFVEPQQTETGAFLFFLAAMINHDANGNTHRRVVGQMKFARAARAMTAGEELTWRYSTNVKELQKWGIVDSPQSRAEAAKKTKPAEISRVLATRC